MTRLAPLLAGLMACYASHETGRDDRPDSAVAATDGGPEDGGSIVDGPLLTDCVEAAASGREGQRCAFEDFCRGSDLCTTVDANCWDGRLSINRWRYGEEGLDLSSCTSSTGMADIRGTTPFGPLELSLAWASHSHAFAVDAVLVAHELGGGVACGSDRLGLFLRPNDWSGPPGYLGVHDVAVLVTMGDRESAVVPGVFEVVETDFSQFIEGNLTVDHGEWRLSGSIAAEPCPALGRSSP